jgi:hypothetical protein
MSRLTPHDRAHLAQYLTLLHGKGKGRTDAEMARDICGIDPEMEPVRARKVLTARLRRAHWLAEHAHLLLVETDAPPKSRRRQRNRVR